MACHRHVALSRNPPQEATAFELEQVGRQLTAPKGREAEEDLSPQREVAAARSSRPDAGEGPIPR